MAKLIFRMRGVPDDEAEEVRELLVDNQIDFYETSAGNWGISLPAIWITDDRQYEQARQLLQDYQVQRSLRMREEYDLQRKRGEAPSLWHSFREDPMKFIGYMGLVAAVLYLSLQFFLSF